ncbi:MAG: FAD-binding oxidoreductase [Desulfobacteraceae bacterium]|nr:FAD-binding oxidoreductase [Desulfobacteraceae bacterium]
MAINIDGRLESFRNDFSGEVILPTSDTYDDARRVWNGMINKRPALIAKCSNVDDVVKSIRFARNNDLAVSIRGGGHNVAGFAVIDDGLVVDLSLMRSVVFNSESRTVFVEGGALWGDVDPVTQKHGLATPGGEVSLTGVAGLTLGGGVGYLRRKHGLSCDNLLSVEIVTAEGQILKVGPDQNADLFWALRGGGGNFGVITKFEFKLHPVSPEVATVNPLFPASDAERLLRVWRDFTESAPNEASTAFAFWGVPEHPDIPEELVGIPVCLFDGMYAGSPGDGEALFNPLRNAGQSIMDMSGRSTYLEVQTAFDQFMPDGDLYYWKSLFLDDLSDEKINVLLSWAESRPNPRILVIIRHMGGAIRDISENDTAFFNRHANFMLSIDGAWTNPIETKRNIAWIRDFWKAMSRFSDGGVYVNFPGFGENDQALWKSSYGANYQRLATIKAKYDPDNFFRMNQNIRPSK